MPYIINHTVQLYCIIYIKRFQIGPSNVQKPLHELMDSNCMKVKKRYII